MMTTGCFCLIWITAAMSLPRSCSVMFCIGPVLAHDSAAAGAATVARRRQALE